MRKSKTAVGQLQIIKDLYTDKNRWTQNTMREWVNNKIRYCLVGAAKASDGSGGHSVYSIPCAMYLSKAVSKLKRKKMSYDPLILSDLVIRWNDNKDRTITDIRKAVNLALELAKKDEARAA